MSGLGFFVRAKELDRQWTVGERTREERGQQAVLSGEEARDFYQSLFSEEHPNGEMKEQEERRERRKRGGRRAAVGIGPRSSAETAAPPGVSEREGLQLLRCAQDGDVRRLRELLDRGADINIHDEFYWTPLMCGSFGGKREVVRLLLERGAAWVGVTDTQGRDARSLALQAGHQDVVRELDEFGVRVNTHPLPPNDVTHSPRWCEVCEVSYSDALHTHCSSTLHQFNAHTPTVACPHYCLPETSVSYRMMLRSGWDPRLGLGPSPRCPQRPLATVLKRDLTGLGFGTPQRAKVTHFRARDPRAVRTEPARRTGMRLTARNGPDRQDTERGTSLTVKERKRREERERNWERDFRMSFNIDT
ncbi:G patch domain and ankyrin repeat-containing protein 1 [Hoplias malabaricus]|uniref:G patch domain and ankyrin repeat-containing protein 1 n=1 Tax=Hoplias malabaricus TaxID=27720 RepID=UPI00346326E2